jgi:5-methylcytosine-specific restriction endonuclease McrA
MVHECPECEYETESEHGLSIHFGSKHDGSLSDYGINPSMTEQQISATSQYERPSKETLQEWSDTGLTFPEMADKVDPDATRHTISYWFDKLDIDHNNQGQKPSGNGKYRDKQWLKSKIDSGKGVVEISNELNVNHKTIERWVNKFNIDYTSKNTECVGTGKYRDKEWMQEMHDKYDEQKDIAKECGATLSVVNKWAKRLDIDYESRYERQRNPDAGWRERDKWDETRFAVYDRDDYTCQECGQTNCEVHAHHIEFVSNGGAKYDMENLVTLCKDCHMSIHNGGN